MAAVQNRDIIVIGGSAGGFEVLTALLPRLPGDLPATVLIVLHTSDKSRLAEALAHLSRLPLSYAQNGETLHKGRVYVAVPDHHLLIHDGHMLLRQGPRENHSRPAIDPLFRSAAVSHAARVIGLVLSGSLNDGTAGLMAVKQCGGVTMVQDPQDAIFPEMPSSARWHVDPDRVVRTPDLAQTLDDLSREASGPTPPIPDRLKFEVAMAAQELQDMTSETQHGKLTRFTCPECEGALWEITDGTLLRYRCHVGHAFTADTMLAMQEDDIEQMLWRLLRKHIDHAELAGRAAERMRRLDSNELSERLIARSKSYSDDAELFRRLLNNRLTGAKSDPQTQK